MRSTTKDIDMLVLSKVNAPYRRNIDANMLTQCLDGSDAVEWLPHLANFFSDVSTDLILGFAERHGIPRSRLQYTYAALSAKTGERNTDLEEEFARHN